MERMARGPSLLGIDTRKDLGVAIPIRWCNLATHWSHA
jgi:hypothetical protein